MTPQQINRLVDDEVGSSPDSIVIFAEALAQAAYETASHMRSDWQARIWEKIGKEYDSVAARVNKLYGMMT